MARRSLVEIGASVVFGLAHIATTCIGLLVLFMLLGPLPWHSREPSGQVDAIALYVLAGSMVYSSVVPLVRARLDAITLAGAMVTSATLFVFEEFLSAPSGLYYFWYYTTFFLTPAIIVAVSLAVRRWKLQVLASAAPR
jgi:uncharacterized membrane protein